MRKRLRQRLNRVRRPAWFGTLRRTTMISGCYGYDRGRPIDRYYIEGFFRSHRADIRGHVLEVKEPLYTDRYGMGVVRRDVVDKNNGNPQATIVADLATADSVADDTFDCCIITQTLQYIYNLDAAMSELHRMLRPGGVLLATVPGITRLDRDWSEDEHWRFTPATCKRLLSGPFNDRDVHVQAHGNVLTSIAFLQGLAQEELSATELETHDPLFPLLITVRAVKQARP